MSLRAVPYINTRGSEKYKELLRSPFKDNCELYFKNIKNSDIVYDEGFYYYRGLIIGLTPSNLDEFISDMIRIGKDIEWKEEVISELEPQDYLPVNEIEDYYANLLDRMEKGHELMKGE